MADAAWLVSCGWFTLGSEWGLELKYILWGVRYPALLRRAFACSPAPGQPPTALEALCRMSTTQLPPSTQHCTTSTTDGLPTTTQTTAIFITNHHYYSTSSFSNSVEVTYRGSVTRSLRPCDFPYRYPTFATACVSHVDP